MVSYKILGAVAAGVAAPVALYIFVRWAWHKLWDRSPH